MRRAARILACLLWVAPVAAAQEAGESPVTHVRPLAATGTPTVDVDLGRADLRVERTDRREVRVLLRSLPGRGGPAPSPEEWVAVTDSGATVRIAATGPDVDERGVAVVIEVPEGTVLRVRMGRGDVSVTGVTGSLDLATRRGDVTLAGVSGSALVDVEYGSVRASFASMDPRLPSAFATLDGNVELDLPAAAAFDLDVRCRGCSPGDVALEAPLRRTRLLDGGERDAILGVEGPVNGGGPSLMVFTWNGVVRIRSR